MANSDPDQIWLVEPDEGAATQLASPFSGHVINIDVGVIDESFGVAAVTCAEGYGRAGGEPDAEQTCSRAVVEVFTWSDDGGWHQLNTRGLVSRPVGIDGHDYIAPQVTLSDGAGRATLLLYDPERGRSEGYVLPDLTPVASSTVADRYCSTQTSDYGLQVGLAEGSDQPAVDGLPSYGLPMLLERRVDEGAGWREHRPTERSGPPFLLACIDDDAMVIAYRTSGGQGLSVLRFSSQMADWSASTYEDPVLVATADSGRDRIVLVGFGRYRVLDEAGDTVAVGDAPIDSVGVADRSAAGGAFLISPTEDSSVTVTRIP